LCYPEYRGNGVMASLGNIVENQHAGKLFADFLVSTMGLHVNGQARIVPSDHPAIAAPLTLEAPGDAGRREPRPEHWVMVSVEEAYVHCSKHIPLLQKLDKAIHWGSDAAAHKGGDYFRAKHSAHRRPAQEAAG
ncbi:MAG TPA: hypothetical protein VND24_08530, partial [Steroidobacteraceae bacterium]|nr:hypothetical protein [Steroidobacteraceae bacterium]